MSISHEGQPHAGILQLTCRLSDFFHFVVCKFISCMFVTRKKGLTMIFFIVLYYQIRISVLFNLLC